MMPRAPEARSRRKFKGSSLHDVAPRAPRRTRSLAALSGFYYYYLNSSCPPGNPNQQANRPFNHRTAKREMYSPHQSHRPPTARLTRRNAIRQSAYVARPAGPKPVSPSSPAQPDSRLSNPTEDSGFEERGGLGASEERLGKSMMVELGPHRLRRQLRARQRW